MKHWFASLAILALALAGCGSFGSSGQAASPAKAPASASVSASAPAASTAGQPSASTAAGSSASPSASAGQSSAAGAVKTIEIGAAISLTGPVAREGRDVKNGYDLWATTVNAKGGIDVGGTKYKVHINYADDQGDPKTAARLTTQFISEKHIKLLLGPYSSGITTATAAIGEQYGALTIASEANGDSIYQHGYKMIVSVLPPASHYLWALLDMAKQLTPRPRTVAIASRDDLFGLLAGQGAQKRAQQDGFKVVYAEKFPPNSTDLSVVISQAKAKNPDIFLSTGLLADSILLARQGRDAAFLPKIFGFTVGPEIPDFEKSLKSSANGLYGSSWWLPDMSWKGPEFGTSADYAKTYKKKFNQNPSYQAASGTQAGLILQLGIEKAASLDPAKVRAAIGQLDTQTFWGPT
ncbi:MAG: amino acid ABC transporter substrate-binding protein, partial [Chloroflexota bacterium]